MTKGIWWRKYVLAATVLSLLLTLLMSGPLDGRLVGAAVVWGGVVLIGRFLRDVIWENPE